MARYTKTFPDNGKTFTKVQMLWHFHIESSKEADPDTLREWSFFVDEGFLTKEEAKRIVAVEAQMVG